MRLIPERNLISSLNVVAAAILCMLGYIQAQPYYSFAKSYHTVFLNYPNEIRKTIEVIDSEDTAYVSVGGGIHAFLIKTSANGDLLWGKSFSEMISIGNSVKRTNDGGYIFVGKTQSAIPGSCSNPYQCSGAMMIKTDSVGNLEWSRRYYGSGTTANNQSQAFDVEIVNNGYIIVGESSAFSYITPNGYFETTILIRLDLNGNLLWSKNYPFYNGGAVSLVKISDNSFMIATHGFCFIKIDSVGNVINCSYLGIPCYPSPRINQMISTSDGGFLVVGKCGAPFVTSSSSLYVAKTDSLGVLEWSKAIGNGTNISQGWGIARDLDGAYVVAGVLHDSTVNKMLVLKLDTLGNVVWVNSAFFNNHSFAFSILPMNGGYLAAGLSGLSDVFVKLDGVGMFACNNMPTIVSDTIVVLQKYVTGGYTVDITSQVLFTNPGASIVSSNTGIIDSVFCETMFLDLKIEQILSPAAVPAGTSLYPSFGVKNIGTDTIFGFDFHYSYAPLGGSPIISSTTESYNDTLLPGQDVNLSSMYHFLVSLGHGNLCVYADVLNDANLSNNSLCNTIIGSTGIADQSSSVQANLVFPNPSNGFVTVRGEGVLVIYDPMGKILQSWTVSDEEIYLDLPPGFYLYAFLNQKGKLIVI
jgi:hypothetical protein